MLTMPRISAATPPGSGNEGTVISGDLDATDADGLSDTTYFTIKTQGSERHGGDRRRHWRLDVRRAMPTGSAPISSR